MRNTPEFLAEQQEAAPSPFGSTAYCDESGRRADPRDLPFREAFCGGRTVAATPVTLTVERRHDLDDVQREVNAAVQYRTTTTWDPLADAGDCKTYVARKELELLNRGWPAGALRVATAFVNDGGAYQYRYHTVLLVDTDRGTFVLDNRYREPRQWGDTSYVWMTAQVPGRGGWARLPADSRQVALALAANTRRPESLASAVQ